MRSLGQKQTSADARISAGGDPVRLWSDLFKLRLSLAQIEQWLAKRPPSIV